MQPWKLTMLITTSLALAACGDGGGGGGGLASAPAPDPNYHGTGQYSFTVQKPLAPAPAWNTGTYQGIALVRNELNGDNAQAPAGTVRLAVDTAAKTYTLTVSTGSVTVAPTLFSIPGLSNPTGCGTCWTNTYIGSTVKSVTHWSDGIARPETDGAGDATFGQYHSQTNLAGKKALDSFLTVSSTPGRHVSLGYWSLSEAPLNPDGTRGVTSAWSSGQFAFGDRTAPGGIPASGTARYTVETPEDYLLNAANPIRATVFDVDFAAQSIAANISHSREFGLYPDGAICCYGGEEFYPDEATRVGTITLATHASGIAPISAAGDFNIALAGTALVHTGRVDNAPVADISSPVSGAISGAFFGPQAGELGGTYILPGLIPDGTVQNLYGAFTAVQSAP